MAGVPRTAGQQIDSRYGSVVARSGGKLILVDSGLQAPDSILLDQMRSRGVDPEAVDLMVFTYLQPDHVGRILWAGSYGMELDQRPAQLSERPVSNSQEGLG